MITYKNYSYLILVIFFITDVVDTENENEIMLAHYFFFLSLVNILIFIGITHIYACFLKSGSTLSQNKELRLTQKVSFLIWLTFIWLCVKYKYNFNLILVIQSIVYLIDPITYFYHWGKPGM